MASSSSSSHVGRHWLCHRKCLNQPNHSPGWQNVVDSLMAGVRGNKQNSQRCSSISFRSNFQENQELFELLHRLMILFSDVIGFLFCFLKSVALLVGHKPQRPLLSTLLMNVHLCGVCTCVHLCAPVYNKQVVSIPHALCLTDSAIFCLKAVSLQRIFELVETEILRIQCCPCGLSFLLLLPNELNNHPSMWYPHHQARSGHVSIVRWWELWKLWEVFWPAAASPRLASLVLVKVWGRNIPLFHIIILVLVQEMVLQIEEKNTNLFGFTTKAHQRTTMPRLDFTDTWSSSSVPTQGQGCTGGQSMPLREVCGHLASGTSSKGEEAEMKLH